MANGNKSGRFVVPKPLRETLEQAGGVPQVVERRSSMIKIDGLWVHQGVAQPGANWDSVVQDVREERIESVQKT